MGGGEFPSTFNAFIKGAQAALMKGNRLVSVDLRGAKGASGNHLDHQNDLSGSPWAFGWGCGGWG